MFPHKLEISEINPGGCRPFLEYPWHAEGPPVDPKDDQLTTRKEIQELAIRNEILCREYQEKLKRDPNFGLVPRV